MFTSKNWHLFLIVSSNSWTNKWETCHVTIRFFEITYTFKSVVALWVNNVFTKHRLNGHVHICQK
jgi:hypothetical protein